MNDVIVVENLAFSYQQDRVLENITFKISENESVGIIGPNGGGKTTLLMLLMGFLKPDQGSIKIFGKSTRQTRKKIGYVPQTFRYDKDFPITALEVVCGGLLSQTRLWGGFSREDKLKAMQALEKMGLEKFHKASFSDLSGGQAQRVLFARALVSEPKILFLDEVTANVDQAAQLEIYNHLDQLKREITILMVTHDLKAALKHVDRVLCVEKEIASFSPKEVCEHFTLGLYHPRIKQ